ncbi:MAG: radical SAM family heme chaperone HemW [Ferruginibacter sp.]
MSGVYIHIPFCKQACHYCNFHFSTSLKMKKEMIDAIVNEIILTPFYNVVNEKIDTIYFGGGTPSILTIEELQLILEKLQNKFKITPDAEITLEANPDDITTEKLVQWKKAGINRLSTGVQSFLETELKWMNRAHNVTDALNCIDAIKDAGYIDYSIDLIYGSPLLSNEDWKRNVSIIFEKNVPHISCYALTVEPKTALDKMIAIHKKEPVDTEKQAEQFLILMDWMKDAGYEHYEISNFSKPGMRSKHNSSYWQGKFYYGFGPSAHSFDGASRRWNVANNSLYLQSLKQNTIPYEEEILSATQKANEYIMTALRTMEGIDLEKTAFAFGQNIAEKILSESKKWQTGNKIILTQSKLILTREGKLFADGIAADLFITEK